MFFYLRIILLGFIPSLFAQTIENVDFYVESQRIVVRYDLIYPKPDTLINVSLDFRNDKGDKITPVSVTGDLNKVKPGVGKHINWDALKDQAELSGKYKAELSIEQIKTIQIGTQVWMVENLNVDRFRNGDLIHEARTNEAWQKAGDNKQPAWCYYDNDPKNGVTYGKLYNWFAVNDPRGLAPKGYHVPSDAEWAILTNFCGGESVAGKKLKSTRGWNEDNNGIDLYGFTGIPSGIRSHYDHLQFGGVKEIAIWWTSTKSLTGDAWYYGLSHHDGIDKWGSSEWTNDGELLREGHSIRCIRD